ncbi:hypothetical protein BDZ91DRAFT_721929 [Kalaharituber pfeilii]|nr:hypothetical protein BDZ91DRAFT_721929 [Kalaharituber pfeilii]
MAPLNVAILGSGIFVREEHEPAIVSSPSWNLLAIYSRTRLSAEKLADGKKYDIYSDDSEAGKQLDDLLARRDLDAVLIALPILVQPQIIKKCLHAGKHVLSEKPIAPDLKSAQELLDWYAANFPEGKPVWGVAENFRFMEAWVYGRKVIEGLGRILTFSVQTGGMTRPGTKYYETEWRRVPGHQGGFLLDAGVHQTAGLLSLLPSVTEDPITRISAFTTQLQPHLPPVDTVSATLRLKSGVVGFFSASFGTTVLRFDFTVGAESGSVTVSGGGKVTVRKANGTVDHVKEFPEDKTGVKQEIEGFAASLTQAGGPQVDPRQRPELAYNDLALIETMLQSGEKDGAPLSISFKMI